MKYASYKTKFFTLPGHNRRKKSCYDIKKHAVYIPKQQKNQDKTESDSV
jgi:hypothetical protein